ncbi:Serine/threonine-protein kinase PknB [Streptomyces sp. ADI96-02]|uniref:protein kinase domain-containing protein n=1 Tax=Streptomyces sp. ADI96-02 TaxID=1522760 RepID=UPI000F54CAB1|nr:protein kinase [Streptomyces sp. ADI96-02]RPK62317.1 Serine/threonine-protein kinase PknB [Streptomyces sp. ADI96-02]
MSEDGARGRHAGEALAGGRYQLRGLLGEGGMASVYLAYDSALDRQVAIKTLHTELGREQSFRERFRREAQAVAKLQHTNIVSVFDTGEDELGGALMPYIVMEYVEGQPLGSVLAADIRQYGAMPADKALRVTADVLSALEASHERGLVHRDIKPGNVMMTGRGVVKVMDFGIARAMQSGVTSMTQTGMVVGTPQYLSPEQALGRGVDARSDLYSVGVMLFQLLTGRIPFDADSALAIAYAHVQEDPGAPSAVNRSVTPAMDALVARALKKNPNERFPSAAAMRDETLRVLNASAGRAEAPAIVAGGGPVSSGSGVGSAVFPPVDQAAPAPQSLQTPYQPHPQHQPHPSHPHVQAHLPGPYAPQVPQVPAQGYGYPQAAPGYPSPGPLAHQTSGPPAHGTPPPYTVAQQQPGGGSRRNMPVVLGSILVALLAIGGLVTVLSLQNDDEEARAAGGGSGAQGTGETVEDGYRPPERNRTMKTTQCTDAMEDSNDPQKVAAPNFVYKDVLSAKACAVAAGWTVKVVEEPGNTYAEDQVVSQFPSPGTAVPERGADFELKVSTGRAG